MKIIVITPPYALERESELIMAALGAGAYRVHIRKPTWSRAQTAELVESIPPFLRERITLHDYFDLYEELGVGGLHVNGRNREFSAHFLDSKSRSCHTLEELRQSGGLDYATLSPIYDSISKVGYCSNFSYRELLEAKREGYLGQNTVALGGVTPKRITELYYLGFGGAALMGYVWQDATKEGVARRVKEAVKIARMCTNFSLQYITHKNATTGYVEGAEAALKGGARWVQLRAKDISNEEFISYGEQLRVMCDKAGATFILNDRVDLVHSLEADGVHLGREDMSPSQARKILGDDAIIGGTANTIEDIDRLIGEGVDYIGLGPFRFTTTKQRLSPTLGIEGYFNIVRDCIDRAYNTPIVAIGGITKEDISLIMESRVMGVALSGEILNAADSVATTREIVDILKMSSKGSPKDR